MNNTRDTFGELRGFFDGSDSFMREGHQLIIRRKSKRKTPPWAYDNRIIQNMLLIAFPRLSYCPIQRMFAARWARVIQMFFRTHHSYADVAEELGISHNSARMLVRNISRRARGLRTSDGKPTVRPPGHPRKTIDTPGTSKGSPRTK